MDAALHVYGLRTPSWMLKVGSYSRGQNKNLVKWPRSTFAGSDQNEF